MKHQSDRAIIKKALKARDSMEKGRKVAARSMRKMNAMNEAASQKAVNLQRELDTLKKIGDTHKQSAVLDFMPVIRARIARCPRCQDETTPGTPFCSHCGAQVKRHIPEISKYLR